jgi:hypothetical protein
MTCDSYESSSQSLIKQLMIICAFSITVSCPAFSIFTGDSFLDVCHHIHPKTTMGSMLILCEDTNRIYIKYQRCNSKC